MQIHLRVSSQRSSTQAWSGEDRAVVWTRPQRNVRRRVSESPIHSSESAVFPGVQDAHLTQIQDDGGAKPYPLGEYCVPPHPRMGSCGSEDCPPPPWPLWPGLPLQALRRHMEQSRSLETGVRHPLTAGWASRRAKSTSKGLRTGRTYASTLRRGWSVMRSPAAQACRLVHLCRQDYLAVWRRGRR